MMSYVKGVRVFLNEKQCRALLCTTPVLKHHLNYCLMRHLRTKPSYIIAVAVLVRIR